MNAQPLDMLSSALERSSHPSVNRQFLLRVLGDLEFTDVVSLSGYLKLIRPGSQKNLVVTRSSLCGFSSPEEAFRITGSADTYPSESRPGTWCINLPDAVIGTRGTSSLPRSPKRVLKPCPECFIEMDLTGTCARCV